MIIKGINTASIKQSDHFVLMTFKINDHKDTNRILYMQITTLVDFIIILRSRMLKVSERLVSDGIIYKKNIQDDIESLTRNIPEIISNEVMEPNSENLVTSITPKFKNDSLTLIVMLQSEQLITLEINDTQVEFIIIAIQKALEAANDKETLQVIGSLLDFALCYSVDLSNLEYLNYKEIKHEFWKLHLFSEYMTVLYCFETERGKEILAGTVIKTSAQPETQEVASIVQRIVHLTPMLKVLKEKYPLYQTFCQRIPSQPMQILTKEECLAPLHAFCLKTQAALKL
ncbi:YjeJ family protein [Klebsiella pasteurii]|uniref:YjeJ family protein n=1 Tax=Klebsiella pasteurii TaxID=2587529 RepID=UPI00237B1CBA|nr:YjeJ family protein [Klebsiella pasteurii]MDD9651790.1 YjeJ family protein [Klebsiella pasteurii]